MENQIIISSIVQLEVDFRRFWGCVTKFLALCYILLKGSFVKIFVVIFIEYFGSMYKMYSCIDVQLLFQGKKTQETIPHECVLYFVGDFRVNNWYSVKDFRIMTNVGRTRTTNNIFKLKFTISTIIKHIPSVSTLLYFHPASFADIIHRRLDFKISVK